MNVVFRVDAGHRIGSGHLMRCLTLADVLAESGARCRFITRAHDGHLASVLERRGFTADVLPLRRFDGGIWDFVDGPATTKAIG